MWGGAGNTGICTFISHLISVVSCAADRAAWNERKASGANTLHGFFYELTVFPRSKCILHLPKSNEGLARWRMKFPWRASRALGTTGGPLYFNPQLYGGTSPFPLPTAIPPSIDWGVRVGRSSVTENDDHRIPEWNSQGTFETRKFVDIIYLFWNRNSDLF